ncbi:uncharacterized protein LOC141627884 [Silene latifolia]|uniref:uncharacterized protein LOC141627884 n=1 Tax=Silene latifolia TaxID=37657 RepID=UPI003D783AA5
MANTPARKIIRHSRQEILAANSGSNHLKKGPWVICGDFNTVLQPSERLGGSSTMEEMDDFKACVDECEVTRVYSRLDRVLVNQEWLQNNGQAFAHFFCESTFDHTPCVVQRKTDLCKRNRSFKYFNMWSKSVDFIPCVQLNWGKKWPGTKMFNLVKKLKHLKRPLKDLNRVDFDDIENTTARARMYLESIQIKLRSEPQG